MKIYYLNILVLILLMSVIFSPVRAGENDVAKPVKKTQKSSLKLFNGKNLDGWYTFLKGRGRNSDPNKVFTVINGLLRVSGEEYGCITTNEEIKNYKILIKLKGGKITHPPRVDKARDS